MDVFSTNGSFMPQVPAGTVALTFDDGPDANVTPAILDILDQHNIKATFFVTGKGRASVNENKKFLIDIAARGHLLANHGYEHVGMHNYEGNNEWLLSQVLKVDELIRPINQQFGNSLHFFRAPEGAWKPSMANLFNAHPLAKTYIGPIFWHAGGAAVGSDGFNLENCADYDISDNKVSIWQKGIFDSSIDACVQGYAYAINQKPGGIVLLHDVHRTTITLLEKLLNLIKNKNYSFVRLDQLPGVEQYVHASSTNPVLPPPIPFFEREQKCEPFGHPTCKKILDTNGKHFVCIPNASDPSTGKIQTCQICEDGEIYKKSNPGFELKSDGFGYHDYASGCE